MDQGKLLHIRAYSQTFTNSPHYKINQRLDAPFIEYARYVLLNGTESEKTALAASMETILQIRHGELDFYKSM